jgi:hypothetical protein
LKEQAEELTRNFTNTINNLRTQMDEMQKRSNIRIEQLERQIEQQLKEKNGFVKTMSSNTIIHTLMPSDVQESQFDHPEVYTVNTKSLMERAKRGPDFKIKVYHDGGRYEGNFSGGKRHGIGAYHYPSGNLYIGEWKKGLRSGIGMYQYIDGNKFCGEWKNDVRDGRGTGWFADQGIYTGDYKAGKRSGYGVYTYPSGNQYTGSWNNGKRHGHGVYVYKDGERYDGNWAKDLRNGYGEVTWPDGRTYKGQWKAGLRHGHAIQKTAEYHFEGEFISNKKSGNGKIRFYNVQEATGIVEYEGEFKDDEMHGKGYIVTKGGDVIHGLWEHNVLQNVTKYECGFFKTKLWECNLRDNNRIKVWWGEEHRWSDISMKYVI